MKRIKIEETDSWQKPILSISNNGTATKGNRYIVGATPTGEFSGFTTNTIVTYSGTAWLEDVPVSGWVVYDLNQDLLLLYEGGSWSIYEVGVPAGGTTGQVLKKIDATDYNTQWADESGGGGGSYDDSEAQTYFAALVTPLSGTQENRISDLVLAIKKIFNTNDLSELFDCLYLFANETQEASQLNLIKRSHDITEVNTPTWTQWQGYTGDGSSSYLNSNYNPSTQAVSFFKYFASVGIYIRGSVGFASNMVDVSAYDATNLIEIQVRNNTQNFVFRVNSSASNSVSNGDANPGWFSSRRISRNFIDGFAQKSATESSSFQNTTAITAIPNANIFFLARNTSGTPSIYSSRQISLAYVGRGMDQEQAIRLHFAFEKYMVAIGTGVL